MTALTQQVAEFLELAAKHKTFISKVVYEGVTIEFERPVRAEKLTPVANGTPKLPLGRDYFDRARQDLEG